MALSFMQRAFVDAFLVTWQPTKAARIAGYRHPDRLGSRLMKNPEIAAAVTERIKASAMPADEALARLAEQARVNMGDFIKPREVPVWQILGLKPPDSPAEAQDDEAEEETEKPAECPTVMLFEIDMDAIKDRGHLVKKISMTKYGPAIELHDGQTALITIAKHLRLLADQVDVTSGGEKVRFVALAPEGGDETP